MSKSYAKFYKCALQVNPYSYIKYRGLEHEMTEEQYNESIYQYCKGSGTEIIFSQNLFRCITPARMTRFEKA